MRHLLPVFTVVVLGLSLVPAAGAKKPPLCPADRFLRVDAPSLPTATTVSPGAIDLRSGTLVMSGCAPAKFRTRKAKHATVVRARLSCGALGRVRIKARIDATTCRVMTARLRGRKIRPRVSLLATPSRCGDGVLDAGDGEVCDPTAPGGDAACVGHCTPFCVCAAETPAPTTSTTTTTVPPALPSDSTTTTLGGATSTTTSVVPTTSTTTTTVVTTTSSSTAAPTTSTTVAPTTTTAVPTTTTTTASTTTTTATTTTTTTTTRAVTTSTSAPTTTTTTLPGGSCAVSYAGCTHYVDERGSGSAPTIKVSDAGYNPRCMRIRVGQRVTFRMHFAHHPLRPAPCTPAGVIPRLDDGGPHQILFDRPGVFGFYEALSGAADGSGMAGAILVEALP